MDYDAIVEKYLVDFGNLCTQKKFGGLKYDINELCDITTSTSQTYKCLMESYEDMVYEFLQEVIIGLMSEHQHSAGLLNLWSYTKKAYRLYEGDTPVDFDDYNSGVKLAIALTFHKEKQIYFFKKFGINNRLQDEKLIKHLLEVCNAKEIIYVSFVSEINQKEIFKLPIDKQNNISIQDFFVKFFSKEEYYEFEHWCNVIKKKSKELMSFDVIPSIKNNSLYSYRKYIEDNILNFNFTECIKEITVDQHEVIKSNFLNKSLYKCMIGKSDFAESFMTAEWLYITTTNSSHIDLTVVALGYLKSIEQFLYKYVKCYAGKIDERTGKYYKIRFKENRADEALTEEVLNKFSNKMTLGTLTGFIGYINLKQQVISRNITLLDERLSQATNDEIIRYLSSIMILRNDHFHKDNIDNWNLVNTIRNNAYCIYYLILGGYKQIDEFINKFEIINEETMDDYKLCKFVYELPAYDLKGHFLIFRIENSDGFYSIIEKDNIKFDSDGIPQFSGIYVKEIYKDEGDITFYPIGNLPCKIRMAYVDGLDIRTKAIEQNQYIFKTIFKDGKFLVD